MQQFYFAMLHPNRAALRSGNLLFFRSDYAISMRLLSQKRLERRMDIAYKSSDKS
jgi:hypothetical protein